MSDVLRVRKYGYSYGMVHEYDVVWDGSNVRFEPGEWSPESTARDRAGFEKHGIHDAREGPGGKQVYPWDGRVFVATLPYAFFSTYCHAEVIEGEIE